MALVFPHISMHINYASFSKRIHLVAHYMATSMKMIRFPATVNENEWREKSSWPYEMKSREQRIEKTYFVTSLLSLLIRLNVFYKLFFHSILQERFLFL